MTGGEGDRHVSQHKTRRSVQVMIYDTALAYIRERAVSPDAAAHAGLTIVDDAREVDPSFYPRPALAIPYVLPDGAQSGFKRVRYFDPPQAGGVRRKPIRYQQPKGTAPEIYLPPVPGWDWQGVLADPQQPVVITEGEIKSLSVMANTGMPCMGLGGVWMWADNKMPIPLFEATDWTRRRVFIVFDSDIDTKVQVQLAEARLAEWLIRRRAIVHTCRLPPGQDGGKQGADDYIAAFGAASFIEAVTSAPSLSEMDLRVLEMNTEVCWLDGEEKIMEVDTGTMIRKDSFTSGSRFSTLKVPVQDGKRIRMSPVAQTWLSHPMARRYANTLFLPGGPEVIRADDGSSYINIWREQRCEPGDVTPYLDLTRWLFTDTLGPDNWDWPIKLLAYKTQNPTHKVPLAIMMIGEQGSGKSLWAGLTRLSFGAFGNSRNGKDLGQDWNGFLEKCLLCTIDDVHTRQVRANIETLRTWVSEPKIERHEKFLRNREVDNYALLILTSNYRDAGAFAHDDRRFLVVGTPKIDKGEEYYGPLWEWFRSGNAGPNLYHYFLNYDLDGWTPPVCAPLTAEKRMAFEESLSPFQRLARDMQTSNAHVVEMWLQGAEEWALSVLGTNGHADTPKANEILAAIQAFPIRPWYTAEELCNMFPHMLRELNAAQRGWNNAATPGKVSTQLRNAGIYFLRNADDPDGFMWRGRKQQFLIVCPSAGYSASMSQAEFDAHMSRMGTYKPRSNFRR